MDVKIVRIEKPENINFILGQSHFIKTVEDMHEALVAAVPGIKFGLAFCEASGKCLVRWTGTDEAMIELAKRNAQAISHRRRPFLHFVSRRRLFPDQRFERGQSRAGSGARLLRHRQSNGSVGRTDGARARHSGGCGRLFP